ncbi:MAG: triose-phosphate isomerase [archaeon]|nr:triose-phosphate isomerase [Nanoarchaeota archaeon]
MKPLIVINFKTYREASGDNALKLAANIRKVRRSKYQIVMVPPMLTVREIAKKNTHKVFAQYVSPYTYGSHTGSIMLEELKNSGVTGTLLNHSEKKLPFKVLTETIELCKKSKITTIVCASTINEAKKVANLKPNYIAYEPKALIGGDISVTEADPDIIIKVIKAVKSVNRNTKVLVGAGVHSKEDLGHALLLGAHGVLIGHAVAKAKNPKRFLTEMLIS